MLAKQSLCLCGAPGPQCICPADPRPALESALCHTRPPECQAPVIYFNMQKPCCYSPGCGHVLDTEAPYLVDQVRLCCLCQGGRCLRTCCSSCLKQPSPAGGVARSWWHHRDLWMTWMSISQSLCLLGYRTQYHVRCHRCH